jgi:transposase
MYFDILRCLRVAFRKKRHEKWRTTSWFFLHDNAPAHRSVFVSDFIANNNVTILEHPPNSPDLVPADVYLFPQMKSVLKGRVFGDTTDIIKNATIELKRLSKLLPEKSQTHSRWQKCTVPKRGAISNDMQIK